MVNILVIANHHGAFLTLQSIIDHIDDVDEVMVIIPTSQIEKYGKESDPIFTGFKDNIIKFAKKIHNAKIFIGDYDPQNPVTFCNAYLEESCGTWLMLNAGSLFNGITGWQPRIDSMETLLYGITKDRIYQKIPNMDMYHMVGFGPPAPWDDHYKGSMLINANKLSPHPVPEIMALQNSASNGTLKLMPNFMFAHPDSLVTLALGARDIVAFNARSTHALTMNFWAPAITPPERLEDECFHGFPLDKYGETAKKVKKFLPVKSYNNIIANAKQTHDWVSGLRELVLD